MLYAKTKERVFDFKKWEYFNILKKQTQLKLSLELKSVRNVSTKHLRDRGLENIEYFFKKSVERHPVEIFLKSLMTPELEMKLEEHEISNKFDFPDFADIVCEISQKLHTLLSGSACLIRRNSQEGARRKQERRNVCSASSNRDEFEEAVVEDIRRPERLPEEAEQRRGRLEEEGEGRRLTYGGNRQAASV